MREGLLVKDKIDADVDVHDPALRERSARSDRLYARLMERMTAVQKRWGGGVTILDEDGVSDLPVVVRRAKAFEKTLMEMPIDIEGDDLIVGNTVENGVIVRPRLVTYNTAEERAQAAAQGVKVGSGLSHKTPSYDALMSKGLKGILREIEDKVQEIEQREQTADQRKTLALYRAMRIECEAVIQLAARYAWLAEGKAASAESPERRQELERIAEVCARVPGEAPQTFHEAIQSFWFVHYAFTCTESLFSCGRIDQFLYPAYARERAAGTLTVEHAQELIDSLWLRFCDRTQIDREHFALQEEGERAGQRELGSPMVSGLAREDATSPWEAGHRKRVVLGRDLADAINHWGQNVLLGGIRPDGMDGTNDVTYLCMNALGKFSTTDPVVTLRLHRGSPKTLLKRAAEALKAGGGFPFLNNDEAIVKGYVELGVPAKDARDYANSNCWETLIQGKSDQELVRGVNLLLLLELALNRGRSQVHGQMGPDTGDATEFHAFDDVMDAWKTQLDVLLKEGIDYIGQAIEEGTLEHSGHGKYCYNPLLSALTYDCIERERDAIKGGSRYTLWTIMGEGFANTVDALSAIKKLVFDEGAVTMGELLQALEADWEGYEHLRRTIVDRAPKYANDDDDADEIGQAMLRYFIDRTKAHGKRWYPQTLFPPAIGTFAWMQSIGSEVGASLDGRFACTAVTSNMSPVAGADRSGLPAAINSAVKMYGDELPGGAPIDLRVSRRELVGEAGTDRLVALIRAFVDLGGNMLTLTVTDAEELRRAMLEPEQYRHLRVRMGGWTAYFVMLSREQQELQIQRVIHGGV